MFNDDRIGLRRSPWIVCYWEEDRLVYHNYLTGARMTASPVCTAILDLFDGRRQPQDIAAALGGFAPRSVERTLTRLVRLSFLEKEERKNARSEALAGLKGWSPAATFFHLATKDVDYRVRPIEDPRGVRRFVRNHPQPPFFKRYPGARVVALPESQLSKEDGFVDVLLRRRTWREFSSRKVDLDTLSRLLYISWGVTGYLKAEFLGRLPLKTSPSAGARHPVEAYVVPLRVKGLPQGIYHYSSDRHQLECVRLAPMKRRMLSYLGGQYWYQEAAVVVLMTAVFDRVYWKYKYPRVYRTVLLDAGHVCQTFCLAATWLGLAPFCTAALADSMIERDLGIDGVGESVIYAAGVGARP